MHDAPDREKWMADLLTRGSAEACEEIGAALTVGSVTSPCCLKLKSVAIVGDTTIETVQLGWREIDVIVPEGSSLRFGKRDGRNVIWFERTHHDWDAS